MANLTKKFSEFSDGGDLQNNNITVGLESGTNAQFNNPWTFLPEGSTSDRPAPSAAINFRLRLNTDLNVYEYYNPVAVAWIQLGTSDLTLGPFVTYTADVTLPQAFNLGLLNSGMIKQTQSLGIATPAIALLDTDYYGPGMTGPLEAPSGVNDLSGNILLQFTNNIANAVNFIRFNNSQTGSNPQILARGSDPNIGLDLITSGASPLRIAAASGATLAIEVLSGSAGYQHQTNLIFPDTAATRNVTFQDASGTLAYLSDVAGAVTSITGTANQVLANNTTGAPVTGAVTLTLPQSIGTANTPQFAGAYFGSPAGPIATTPGIIQAVGIGGNAGSFAGATYQNTAVNSPTYYRFKSRSAVVGAFVPLQINDTISRDVFFGDDGTSFIVAAALVSQVDGPVSTGIVPGRLIFSTCNSSGVLAQGIEIDSSQNLTAFGTVLGNVTIQALTGLIAGSSAGGTPGSVLLYSGVALKGSLALTAVNNSANFAGVISNASLGQSTTWSIPDPGASTANFIISASPGTQQITTGSLQLNVGSISNLLGYFYSGSTAGGVQGTFTAYSPTASNGSLTFKANGNAGNFDSILSNASCSAARNWALPDVSGTLALTSQLPSASALTKTDDTNVTLTLGGSPSVALLAATSLTLGWTGTLSGTRGGTGANNGASIITLGGSLTTSGAFASTFTMTGVTTVTFPTSGTLATTSQLPSASALSKTDDTNVTLTLGGSPTVALLAATSLTLGWSGQLAVSRGGTGISSFGTGVATALGQNVTGSGGIVLSTAPTLTQITFSSTSGIIGTTTNDNAAAGSVGQLISSQIVEGSALSLASATIKDITSITLTAGDWDVWGNVNFDSGTVTNIANLFGWINTASASFPDTSLLSSQQYGVSGVVTTGQTFGFVVPGQRITVPNATTTVVYLSVDQVFSVSTLTGYGGIYARRRR